MTDKGRARAAKLPLFATVKSAYALTWANLRALGTVAAVTGPVLFLALFVIEWLVWPLREETGVARVLLYVMPSLVASLAIGATAAVAWHRHLLLGEGISGAQLWRLDRSTLRYGAWVILLNGTALIVLIFLIVANIPADPASESATTATPDTTANAGEADADTGYCSICAALFAVVVCIPILALSYPSIRLMLVLPGIAIGDTAGSMGRVWRSTRGNFWRLLLGTIATLLPTLPGLTMGLTSEGRIASAIWSAGNDVVWLVIGLVFVSFLSLAYRHFFPSGAAGGHTPRAE